MELSKKAKWRIVGTCAVALIAGATAHAFIAVTPGFVVATVASPGAAAYTYPVIIDPGTWGDSLAWIRVGRDNVSPYVSLGILMSPANPSFAALSAAPPSKVGWTATFTNQLNDLAGQAAGFLPIEFTYRPANDPANPSWAALPGPSGAVDWQSSVVLQAAETFRRFRDSSITPPVNSVLGPVPVSWLELELGPAPNPIQVEGEFYKYSIGY